MDGWAKAKEDMKEPGAGDAGLENDLMTVRASRLRRRRRCETRRSAGRYSERWCSKNAIVRLQASRALSS